MNSKVNKTSCCVCLNNLLRLHRLTKKDDNITLQNKLKITIPEIDWSRSYKICDPCTNLLSVVYNFRETCLKSEEIRKGLEPIEEILFVKPENNSENYNIEDENIDYENYNEDFDDNDDPNDPNYSEDENKDFKSLFSSVSVSVEINEGDPSSKKARKRLRAARKKLQFHCEQCSQRFVSSTLLIKHCVEEHEMKSKNVRPFACTRCKGRFANSSNLLQHIKYHDAIRSNICTYCGKGFITKTDLNIHEKQHLNKREYKCDICIKCFNTHKDLRSHKLVVHTDPLLWKYFCQVCNKRFPIKSNYDCHVRRHTGEKNFECHLCQRRFTDKCVLQRHMRTHSNVRDFKCTECDKEYKDKRVLQIHMAKIHSIGIGEIKLPSKERKYICHICPKAYYAKNKLTRHLYTHSGEKPFFCTICEKKFNDKSYVKQHMKKTHNVDTDTDK